MGSTNAAGGHADSARPIRLLSVIQGPAFGGAHNQALRLRPLLERRGIETTVVLPDEAGVAAERLRDAGVDTLTVPLRRLRATPSPVTQARFLASFRGDVNRLRKLLRNRDIDVVQVHGATNPHGAIAARKEDVAVVWQLFDTRAPMPLRRVAMPAVTRLADVITTWGEELARVHPGTERLGSRVITVYPPVDSAEFAPDAEARASARARLGVGDDEVLVGSVGVLNPQKGHEHLIRAAALVLRHRDDVRFRVLGGSSPAHAEYERSLQEDIARCGLGDRFRFLDPGADVPRLLQAFDVFAMTSVPRSEGMPTVILEAMNAGKPVVTTAVGAVPELVEAETTALIVEPERPALVAEAILRLVGDRALYDRLAAAGRDRARDRFDLDRLADLHAGAYRAAVARRRGPR